jgi:hypothetical protein
MEVKAMPYRVRTKGRFYAIEVSDLSLAQSVARDIREAGEIPEIVAPSGKVLPEAAVTHSPDSVERASSAKLQHPVA